PRAGLRRADRSAARSARRGQRSSRAPRRAPCAPVPAAHGSRCAPDEGPGGPVARGDRARAQALGQRRAREDPPRPAQARRDQAPRHSPVMKITRDIVLDLLPLYLAGEASSDTRALVEESLKTDPELARLAREDPSSALLPHVPLAPQPDTEMKAFTRTRRALYLQDWPLFQIG